MKAALHWHRISQLDLALCIRLNRVSRFSYLRRLFQIISRMGDGLFWYGLMVALIAFGGPDAWPTVGRMLVAGTVGLMIYKWLKRRTSRPRPFQVFAAISAAAPALDRFSFPSGHTLHAVSLSMIAVAGFPDLDVILYPFALMVAVSRPVLGLHYPSDVAAGALIGAIIARGALLL